MAQEVHCRIRKDKPVFRIWSTVTDSYITNELNEWQLREKLCFEAIRLATEQFERDFPLRVERAKSNGTSSLVSDNQDLNGPWEKERR